MPQNTRLANAFIGVMVGGATATFAYAISHAQTWHPYQALMLLVIAVLTSRMKVALPGLTGTMSVNLPFLLLAVVELNSLEVLTVACLSTVAQTVPSGDRKFRPVQMLFNVSMMAVACGLAGQVSHPPGGLSQWISGETLLLVLSAAVLFLGQTAPVAAIISLTESGTFRRVWMSIAQLSFPYFTLSAGLTCTVVVISNHPNLRTPLLVLPVMYGVYRSFALYFKNQADASQPTALAMAARAGR